MDTTRTMARGSSSPAAYRLRSLLRTGPTAHPSSFRRRALAIGCVAGIAPMPMTASAQNTGYALPGTPIYTQATPASPQSLMLARGTQSPDQNLQAWRFEPSVAILETFTNNVNLSPSATQQSDLVTQITPQLAISGKGPRARLDGVIAAPILVYVHTGAENNQVYPSVNLLGSVDAIEKFVYVEGAVNVTQQYFNPFGAHPHDLANATQNRYTSASYRVTPYIKGTTPGGLTYDLRDNNIWTNLSGAPIDTSNSYDNQVIGHVESPVTPTGWSVDYSRDDTRFTDQRPTVMELARASLLYQFDPQLRLNIGAGYENNDFPFAQYNGSIYGAGFHWNPTQRTDVVGNWEHRFFGSSYLFTFEHRTPLSAIKVQASRNTTSYPQQFLSLQATGNVPGLLDFLLQSRIPDPLERLNTINQILLDRGLPNVLTGPVNLYTQQTYLLENASVTYGVLGARNNIYLTGFYQRTEPISGAGSTLPGILTGGNNNTQTGASIAWTHNLTAMMTLNATYTQTHTITHAPFDGTTNQGYFLMGVSAPISPKTIVSIGARYQRLRSDVSPEYNEVAAFAGLNYILK